MRKLYKFTILMYFMMVELKHLGKAIICKEGETIYELSKVFRDTKRRSFVVVDDSRKPVGLVSQTDIVDKIVAEEKNPKEVLVKEIMSSPVITVSLGEDYEVACEKMVEIGTISLPVVDDKGVLVGILDLDKLCLMQEEK